MIFEFLGSPWRSALLILAFGAALAYMRFAKWSRYLTTPSALLLLLMAFGLVGHMLAISLEAHFPTQPDDIEAPDGIVVLGGSVGEMLGDRSGRINFAMAAGEHKPALPCASEDQPRRPFRPKAPTQSR